MANWTFYILDYIKLFIVLFCLTNCQAYTPGGYEGCYRFTSRTLERVIFSGSENKGDDCKDACKNAGYSYAGTRAMNCWCGQNIGSESDEGLCEWGCMGNGGETCGGLYGISIYDADYTVNMIAIIVSVIVVVIVLLIVGIVGFICWRRKKAKKETPDRHISEFRSERSLEPKRDKISATNPGFSSYKSPPSNLRADVSLSPDDDHRSYGRKNGSRDDIDRSYGRKTGSRDDIDRSSDRKTRLHDDDDDDRSYSRKKRTWSQYDDDDYEDSDFTPVAMDDHSYSSYPKSSSYHDTAI